MIHLSSLWFIGKSKVRKPPVYDILLYNECYESILFNIERIQFWKNIFLFLSDDLIYLTTFKSLDGCRNTKESYTFCKVSVSLHTKINSYTITTNINYWPWIACYPSCLAITVILNICIVICHHILHWNKSYILSTDPLHTNSLWRQHAKYQGPFY